MLSTAEAPAAVRDRPARERSFWDEAYHPDGAHHGKYVWVKHVEDTSFIVSFYRRFLRRLRGQRVLSLGGGFDRLGVELARAGNRVVTVDVSPVAAARTRELAEQYDLGDAVQAVVGDAAAVALPEGPYDLVLCKRSLHHMDLPRVVGRAHQVLRTGGALLAEEPVCLTRLFLWLHRRFPFAPNAPRTRDEKELTGRDLALVRATFGTARFHYFDFLSRESVAYCFCQARIDRLLKPLGQADYYLVNRLCPVLRYLSTYVIIHAVK
jgi:SAM-dependent methyltransferase